MSADALDEFEVARRQPFVKYWSMPPPVPLRLASLGHQELA
jgi:hypothetical protein